MYATFIRLFTSKLLHIHLAFSSLCVRHMLPRTIWYNNLYSNTCHLTV